MVTSSLPCPVCGGKMVDHKNDHHVVCTACSYYANVVFMQYFLQQGERNELEKEQVTTSQASESKIGFKCG